MIRQSGCYISHIASMFELLLQFIRMRLFRIPDSFSDTDCFTGKSMIFPVISGKIDIYTIVSPRYSTNLFSTLMLLITNMKRLKTIAMAIGQKTCMRVSNFLLLMI